MTSRIVRRYTAQRYISPRGSCQAPKGAAIGPLSAFTRDDVRRRRLARLDPMCLRTDLSPRQVRATRTAIQGRMTRVPCCPGKDEPVRRWGAMQGPEIGPGQPRKAFAAGPMAVAKGPLHANLRPRQGISRILPHGQENEGVAASGLPAGIRRAPAVGLAPQSPAVHG